MNSGKYFNSIIAIMIHVHHLIIFPKADLNWHGRLADFCIATKFGNSYAIRKIENQFEMKKK